MSAVQEKRNPFNFIDNYCPVKEISEDPNLTSEVISEDPKQTSEVISEDPKQISEVISENLNPTFDEIQSGLNDIEKWVKEKSLPVDDEVILKTCNIAIYVINQQKASSNDLSSSPYRKFTDIIESIDLKTLDEKIKSIVEPMKSLLSQDVISFELEDFEEKIPEIAFEFEDFEKKIPDIAFTPTLSQLEKQLQLRDQLSSKTADEEIGFGLLNEKNEEPKLENKTTLAKDLTDFFCAQLASFLSDSEEKKSPFSSTCVQFLIGLLTDLAPAYVEKILKEIEEKTIAYFSPKNPVLKNEQSTLKNVQGLTEISNDQLAPHILALIQTLSVTICHYSKKESSQFPSLVKNLQSYLLHLCEGLGKPFLESCVEQAEKIILESILVQEENLIRTIPQEWKNISVKMAKDLTIFTDQLITILIKKYQLEPNIIGLLKPCLMALITKIGPKLFEEALYQISMTIRSITDYFSQKMEVFEKYAEKTKKEKTANKLTEIISLYFKDYLMGNPQSENAPFVTLISNFMQGIINHCGPQIFLLLINKRPKELTEDYKTTIIHMLNGICLFLKNYNTALTQILTKTKSENIKEEQIVSCLLQQTLNQGLQVTTENRDVEKKQIVELLRPYMEVAKLNIPNNKLPMFRSLNNHLPNLLLGFIDTLLNSSVKIGFIHRLIQINQPIEIPKKTNSLAPKESKDDLENRQIEALLKEKKHKQFASQLGQITKAIIKQLGNIMSANGLSSIVKKGGSVLTNFLEKSIGNAIFKEIYQVMTQDHLDEKLDLIKSILWKEENNQLVPTLANVFNKNPDNILQEDKLVREALKGQLSALFFKQKSWWLVKELLESICDQLSLELYRIFTMDKVFRVFINDYFIQHTFINSQPGKQQKE